MTRNVTVDDAAEELLHSVQASPKRQRRMLSKTFWRKFGIERRTGKRIKDVKEALRRRGLILNIGGDAELGTETKNKWIVLSYVEPSPQAVTTQAQHSSANVRTSPASSTQMMHLQSAVTHISFPRDFDDDQDRISKLEDWIDDLEELRHASLLASQEVNWTAPRWAMQRDIVFFYMTKSSKTSIDRLAKESNKKRSAGNWLQRPLGGRSRMTSLLARATELSEKYAGTIFGCAQVSGSSEYIPQEYRESLRFQGSIFAPMSNVHIFDNPLRYAEFVDHLQIGQGAITALHGKQFDNIKRLLARKNDLPHFLENARIGGLTFRDVNQDNWPSISSNRNARFIDEAQIRVYLLDFLLKEVRDQRTPVLEECNCYRRRHKGKPKRADYFVRVHERWVPVEAKLNILAERAILDQVAQYINIRSFVPTRGPHRGKEFDATGSAVCLVVDQSGIYLTSDGRFSGCSPGRPVWRREELDHHLVRTIRERIRVELR